MGFGALEVAIWPTGNSKGPPERGKPGCLLPHDRRKRYHASGDTKAEIRMLDDPDLATGEAPKTLRVQVSITGETQTLSPLPTPSLEKHPSAAEDRKLPSQIPVVEKLSLSKTDGDLANVVTMGKVVSHWRNIAGTETAHQPRPRRYSAVPRRRQTLGKLIEVERKHRVSGILVVKGFVLGTITGRSDVVRGGIVPGDWVKKLGWNEDSQNNRVPDVLWRLLVADRTPKGGNPPPWYRRACLHGLVDLRVTDAEGNLHSVTPPDRKISENTTEYFRRVEAVVWNRRLFEATPARRPSLQMTAAGSDEPLFGLAPKGCEDGDLVCIFLGCSVPVVLKKVKNPRVEEIDLFELVGEAYVHGIMDGEAMEDTEGVMQEFVLA